MTREICLLVLGVVAGFLGNHFSILLGDFAREVIGPWKNPILSPTWGFIKTHFSEGWLAWGIIGLVLVILIGIFLWDNRRKNKKMLEMKKQERDELRKLIKEIGRANTAQALNGIKQLK